MATRLKARGAALSGEAWAAGGDGGAHQDHRRRGCLPWNTRAAGGAPVLTLHPSLTVTRLDEAPIKACRGAQCLHAGGRNPRVRP